LISWIKSYERGDLLIGQVSNILALSKNETMDLLKKYNIPFINVDKKYLEQEFNAFN
jgi:predicted HTH domain antitoxin